VQPTDIGAATAAYERWLRESMPLVASDLRLKHARMREAPLPFLRGTYYQWCQRWLEHGGDARAAMPVLAVGDLHVENFGTWRDSDGRLCWGVNDFDEAALLPWTQDLVRLATSALLASAEGHLVLKRRSACDAILEGYREGVRTGGSAFVLEEDHGWLRRIATGKLRDPVAFWARMSALPPATSVPASARRAITAALPSDARSSVSFRRRVAGMGSLGRPRIVGIGDWHSAKVAREVKAIAPSAWAWVRNRAGAGAPPYERLWRGAHRVPDPTLAVNAGWLVRRLAPHSSRIELGDLPTERDEERLLYAMGFDTANVHLGRLPDAGRLRREVTGRGRKWLHAVVADLADALERDWLAWKALR